jgi:ribosomal protein S14
MLGKLEPLIGNNYQLNMLFRKVKDLKTRKNFKDKEILNTSIKFLYTNYLHKNKDSLKLIPFVNLKRKNSSKTKMVRRCIHTNRSRGSIRPYNISRVKLRELFQFGIVPGYKKSV